VVEILKGHVAVGASAVEEGFDEIGKRFFLVFGKRSEYGNSIAIIFLHHGGDSIDEAAKLLDDSLVDIQILCPFQRIEGLVIIPIFYFDLGDFVDGARDCPFVGVVLDCLFVADDGVVGPA
jgi:hypothetical protein